MAESILANGLDGHLSTRFLESITRCLAQMKATIGLFVSGVSSQMIASDAAVFATEIPKFIASGVGITIVTSDCLLPAALRAGKIFDKQMHKIAKTFSIKICSKGVLVVCRDLCIWFWASYRKAQIVPPSVLEQVPKSRPSTFL